MYKSLYPEQSSHSQENLYKNLLCGSYTAHNALADVHALSELIRGTITDISVFTDFVS